MDMVTTSTSEEEWAAIVCSVCRSIFIRDILGVMGFPEGKTSWFCDNRGTMQAVHKLRICGKKIDRSKVRVQ